MKRPQEDIDMENEESAPDIGPVPPTSEEQKINESGDSTTETSSKKKRNKNKNKKKTQ